MAFKHGKTAELLLGGTDITEICNAADMSVDADIASTDHFRADWKTGLAGKASAKYDLKGHFDPTESPNFTSILQSNAVLTVGPAGLQLGDLARLVDVEQTNYGETAPVAGVVGFAASMQANGQVGMGKVAHELSEETADEADNSDYIDLGTAATGWVAHLHVTAVSSGDSIDISLEDSANQSDWAAVTGGAFASATAAGAERLTGTGTLRRYVRVVWDETNDGTPSYTFAVAVARLP